MARVSTQADVDRMVPELLKLTDLCAGVGLACEPTEMLTLDTLMRGGPPRYLTTEVDHPCDKKLDVVTTQGGSDPAHPDWYRTIRDQCISAGVPYNHRGNGEWCKFGDIPQEELARGLDALEDHRLEDKEWCRIIDSCSHHRVGRSRSGRLLDGQVWDQVPEVVR